MVWRKGWTPLLTTNLGWSVKITSTQEDEAGNIWIVSDINWSKPYIKIKELLWVPSGEVISLGHQSLNLALKSPKVIVNDGSSCLIWFIRFSRLNRKCSNSLHDWLGEH